MCDACARADKFPYLYRRECMAWLARQVKDAPDRIRAYVVFQVEAGLEPEQLAEFRTAMGAA